MSNMRRALELAKNVLWEILVQRERGEIVMPEETKKQVDMAEQICTEALEESETR